MWWKDLFSVWGMIIVAIVFGTLATIIPALAKQYRKTCAAANEAALKAEMIKQGRSADEIERILRAGAASAAEEVEAE